MQRVSDLGCRSHDNELRRAMIDVVVGHDNGAIRLETGRFAPGRSLWQRSEQRHCFLDESLHISVNADLRAKR